MRIDFTCGKTYYYERMRLNYSMHDMFTMLEQLKSNEAKPKLNEWEENFVNSVLDQFSKTNTMSDKQLDRIFDLHQERYLNQE